MGSKHGKGWHEKSQLWDWCSGGNNVRFRCQEGERADLGLNVFSGGIRKDSMTSLLFF